MYLAVTAPHGSAAWIAWVAGIAAPLASIAVGWIALRLSRNESIGRQVKERREAFDAARRVSVTVSTMRMGIDPTRMLLDATVRNDSDDMIIEPFCMPVIFQDGRGSQRRMIKQEPIEMGFNTPLVGDSQIPRLAPNALHRIRSRLQVVEPDGRVWDFTVDGLPSTWTTTYSAPQLGTMLEWRTPGGLYWRRFNLQDPVQLTGHFEPRRFLWRRLVIPDYQTTGDCEMWGVGGDYDPLGPSVSRLKRWRIRVESRRDARRKAVREARGY